jgi:hypothetical protein
MFHGIHLIKFLIYIYICRYVKSQTSFFTDNDTIQEYVPGYHILWMDRKHWIQRDHREDMVLQLELAPKLGQGQELEQVPSQGQGQELEQVPSQVWAP